MTVNHLLRGRRQDWGRITREEEQSGDDGHLLRQSRAEQSGDDGHLLRQSRASKTNSMTVNHLLRGRRQDWGRITRRAEQSGDDGHLLRQSRAGKTNSLTVNHLLRG